MNSLLWDSPRTLALIETSRTSGSSLSPVLSVFLFLTSQSFIAPSFSDPFFTLTRLPSWLSHLLQCPIIAVENWQPSLPLGLPWLTLLILYSIDFTFTKTFTHIISSMPNNIVIKTRTIFKIMFLMIKKETLLEVLAQHYTANKWWSRDQP